MITFTRSTRTYDPATDTATTVETTITGSAIQVRGDPRQYKALALVEGDNPTLFFSPTTYGETPAPGDRVTWASKVYSVKAVYPIAPDGVTIAARIIVGA